MAILGMFVAHMIPRPGDAELLVDGRSSILFATLAGVSLALISGGSRPLTRGHRSGAVRSIAIRAFVLFLVGTLLWLTGSEIAIILDYYAVMFFLLLPFLFAPRWVMAVAAIIIAIAAPLAAEQMAVFDRGAADLASVTSEYLFTGYYPAVIWLPFLLVGALCARSDLTSPTTRLAMVGGGLASAILGYGAAFLLPGVTAAAHSSSTAEVVGSGGVAIAVIGFLVTICDPPQSSVPADGRTRSSSARRVTRTALTPIASAGAMALSVYTAQILVLAAAVRVRDSSGTVDYPGWPLLIGLTAATLVASTLWRRCIGRGPLEWLLGLMTRRSGRSPSTPAISGPPVG